VKKIVFVALLLFSALAWAASDSNPADYTVNVHVSSSRMVYIGNSIARQQDLDVVIDGKKCELESISGINSLLALGDYKAKLVQDQHSTAYDSFQVYEFLFSDKKTRKFRVVGQTE
jgi:hypothetical protein